MQRISTNNLRPGMIVAKNIYSADGQLLLCAGVALTAAYIRRLHQLDIPSIYIKAENFPDIEIPELLCEQTRVQAVKNIQKAFENVRLSHKVDVEAVQPVVKSIVAEIIKNRSAMIHLTDIRLYDDYTFAHSVNVCALATMIAVTRGYSQTRIEELALGALLHDIGKTVIPLDVLNKPGKLDGDELTVMQSHSEVGFELLRKSCADMSVVPMHVAYQHQEKFDGSGYPRGLASYDIHEYARIVAIADVYDALTSDRPYRKAMLPHQAYDILLKSAGTHFDSDILKSFIYHIAVYPVGSTVQLSTGDFGVVISVPEGLPFKPAVKLIADRNKASIHNGEIIELEHCSNKFVYKVLDESEVLTLCSCYKK
ncbi:HD-GYP domain-containing protein [Dendrosporobacter sp. 1207_IL3150]|uniref:HD-GYP domain-containing protein n=1 Tax=Dendrosporobacter sp. 1207_IL3150 TaxID=3084054 RepID=UPI002FD98013